MEHDHDLGDVGAGSPEAREALVSAARAFQALPAPVVVLDEGDGVSAANAEAEVFFDLGMAHLCRATLPELLGSDSPVLDIVAEARRSGAAVNGRRLALSFTRGGLERAADVTAAPFPETLGGVVVLFQERTIADKLDRQLNHRGAARSMTALGSMLAHEIKNPLSGIRGAAQLLESSVDDADRALTTLICEETDRIVRLVDRMEVFADERPMEREPVNVHAVLDRVKRLAASGFARGVRFTETYDPSLPPVEGNPDQLVQVLLNLVKNAAEALTPGDPEAEIALTTAYRPGVRLSVPGSIARVSLPLEICVRDNGEGVPPEVLPHLFDPFLTTKARGTGLGLALVAKLVGDHGGVVECESVPRRTVFRILLPIAASRDGRDTTRPRAGT